MLQKHIRYHYLQNSRFTLLAARFPDPFRVKRNKSNEIFYRDFRLADASHHYSGWLILGLLNLHCCC